MAVALYSFHMIASSHRAVTLGLVVCAVSACAPDANRAERVDAAFLEIVAAEDARPSAGLELRVLLDGTRSETAFIRHAAVRALGRLEDPDRVEDIMPLLDDPDPLVRRSAVDGVAQAFHTAPDGSRAAGILLEHVEHEDDPAVRATVARSLGRLPLDRSYRRAVADALVDLSREGDADAPEETLLGVALGLEALVRGHPNEGISARVAERLGELASFRRGVIGEATSARIRTLAVGALGLARRVDVQTIMTAIGDEAWQVGATAARFLDAVPPGQRAEVVRRIVAKRSLYTVAEGFRYLQRAPRTPVNCRYLLLGATPPSPDRPSAPTAIRLLALDALAQPCPDLAGQKALLRSVAGSLADKAKPWQPASHALVSLARLSPTDATDVLAIHVAHENPFVRSYAARVATVLGDEGVLGKMSEDGNPNVQTAAISGLFQLRGHDIDPLLIAQLGADDPQLLLTAADLLSETPEAGVAARAALDAFVRISAAERETWRDPRRALLRLIRSTGGPELTSDLEPYLEDYDDVVADDVATLLSEWHDRTYLASPRPLPRAPLPSADELRAMEAGRVVLHMDDGGTIEIALRPYVATTNAYRLYRLARDGYYHGLTFHRWSPNFVIQGGSPGANEYAGAAAYSRDEVGLPSHWRGTVGISTRGHDTGDAQIFVNLMDNVRLDHAYTVVGAVVDGMDVVDMVLEGTVIARAEFVPGDRVAGM